MQSGIGNGIEIEVFRATTKVDALNLDKSVESRKSMQALDAPGKFKNLLITLLCIHALPTLQLPAENH